MSVDAFQKSTAYKPNSGELMFFQESTPDTSGYLIAGYVIAFLVMGLYVASIYFRSRNLHQDMTILEEMEKPVPPVQMKAKSQPRKSPATSKNNRSARPVTKKSRQK
jgi:hypothetical protein